MRNKVVPLMRCNQ